MPADHTDGRALELFPHFLFRTTGFPIDLLDHVTCTRSVAVADRILAAEASAAAFAARFLSAVRVRVADGGGSSTVSAVAKKVRKRRPIEAGRIDTLRGEGLGLELDALHDFNAALAEIEACTREGDAVLAGELDAARRALRVVATDERFREAVFLSSPGAADAIDGFAADPDKHRRVESKALLYLQRFCSKNDTISFFGPITWGSLSSESPLNLDIRWRGDGLTGRHVFFEHWAAASLAAAIAADEELRDDLSWDLRPPHEWDAARGLTRRHAFGGRLSMPSDPATAAVLDALDDGSADGARVNARTVIDRVVEHGVLRVAATDAFHRLVGQGIVEAFRLPVETLYPLDELLVALRERGAPTPVRARWEGRLEQLLGIRDRFAGASLPERRTLFHELEARFAEWTVGGTRRSGGKTYAGRNILYEECTRHPERFTIGSSLRARLEADLRAVLDVQGALLDVAGPYCWHRIEQMYNGLASGGRPVSLAKFMLKLSSLVGSTNYLQARLIGDADREALVERARECVTFTRDDEGSVRVMPRSPGAAERSGFLAQPVVVAADVMIAANGPGALERGDYRFVIGEIQYFPLGYPEYLWTFHPDRERFAEDYRTRIVERRRTAEPLARVELEPEVTRLIRIADPLADYVLVDGHGRTFDRRRAQRSLADLTVELADGRLFVRDTAGERFVLGNPHIDLCLEVAWQLLVELYRREALSDTAAGRVLPQLVAGERTIVVRRSWTISARDWLGCRTDPTRGARSPFETFLELQRLRRDRGLPRYLFARVPGEVKPVIVDFDSAPLLANLTRMISADADVRFSEMRPAPDELWHVGSDGRHTSEMRVFVA